MSEFISILAWLNFFGLIWGMLLNERLQNIQTWTVVCLFLILALSSSSIAARKNNSEND